MKYVAVMPFIVESFKDDCLAACKLDNLLLVDNTIDNRGVMRSHNLGVDFMRDQDADWLIVLSAAIRFGPAGGLDLVRMLDTSHARAHVVNAVGVYGWHLMAFARETVELAGRWDENFYPYGWDDNDYAIRIHKAQPEAAWWGATLEVTDTIMGHSIQLAGVTVDNEHHLDYFTKKWGDVPGPPFEAYHDTPWGDPGHAVGYWPATELGGQWDQPAPEPIPTTIHR